MSKNTAVIRYIRRHHAYRRLPKWKDLWNLSRIAKEMKSAEFGLQTCGSTYRPQERLHRYKSHPNDPSHREVILRLIERCQKWK
jgi:hypothetical protein